MVITPKAGLSINYDDKQDLVSITMSRRDWWDLVTCGDTQLKLFMNVQVVDAICEIEEAHGIQEDD